VEAAFEEARIVARGNRVFIRGSDDDVERIERVITELVLVLHRNGNLTENDVATVLDLEAAGGPPQRTDGADAILFTCSAFGPAIEAFAALAPRPVLKPNEAMFDQALATGRRLGMLATFAPSVASMEEEFRAQAAAAGVDSELETVLVEPAMAALKAGDADTHNRLLAEAASALDGRDAIMLAHFSTSRALAAVSAMVACPVLTAPRSAVEALRRRCEAVL